MKYGVATLLILGVIGGALSLSPLADDVQQLLTGTRCLKDTEQAVYEVLENTRPGKVRVSVIDTVASSTLWSKDFVHPTPGNAYPIRLQKCAFYAPQSRNYDFEKKEPLVGYSFELWKFDYFRDEGQPIVTMSKNSTGEDGGRVRYYSGSFFNINNSEEYTVLEQGFLGDKDYALVIKNIETGEDEYVLTLDEVLKEHPNAAGSFDIGKWVTRPDGEYLFTTIYDGSRIMAYVYVKLGTWETKIYDTPSDQMAGVEGATPPFAPLMAYTDVIVWAGFAEMTDQIIDEQIASGQKKHLIVADLRSGKKAVVEEVPIIKTHRFKMKWLSDTELEYTMPDGTRKTYTVE